MKTNNKTKNKDPKGNYPKTVLIRIVVTNSELVPEDIKKINRVPTEIIARQKAMEKAADKQAENVNISPYVWELMKAGYDFSDIHYYEHEEPADKNGYKQKKYFIVVAMSQKVRELGYSKKTMKAVFRLIVADAWHYMHKHDNPNGVTSITLLHREPEKGNDKDTGKLMFNEKKEGKGFAYEAI